MTKDNSKPKFKLAAGIRFSEDFTHLEDCVKSVAEHIGAAFCVASKKSWRSGCGTREDPKKAWEKATKHLKPGTSRKIIVGNYPTLRAQTNALLHKARESHFYKSTSLPVFMLFLEGCQVATPRLMNSIKTHLAKDLQKIGVLTVGAKAWWPDEIHYITPPPGIRFAFIVRVLPETQCANPQATDFNIGLVAKLPTEAGRIEDFAPPISKIPPGFLSIKPPAQLPNYLRPVGLAIPVRGNWLFTKACLEFLRDAAVATSIKTVVQIVDNGSPDKTLDRIDKWNEKLSPAARDYFSLLPPIALGRNEGFSAAVNIGIRKLMVSHPSMEFLGTINNDCFVNTHWLIELLGILRQNDQCGLVGPMSNYILPPQKLDIEIKNVEKFKEIAQGRIDSLGGEYRLADVLSGVCLLGRRITWLELGLFDETFGIGMWEDNDLCARAKEANWNMYIALGCFVYHVGSRTFRTENLSWKSLMGKGKNVFAKKWQGKLRVG